jgi:hypothetical protein
MQAAWWCGVLRFRRLTLRSATGTAQRAVPTTVGTDRRAVRGQLSLPIREIRVRAVPAGF